MEPERTEQTAVALSRAPISAEGPQSYISEARALMATIERVSLDPTVSFDKIERLSTLMQSMRTDAERRLFNASMADAQAELPQVVRDAENTQTNSSYATLEAIGAAIDPVITKHGFFLSFDTEDEIKPGCYRVKCTVGHRGGFERTYHADIPIDSAGLKGTVNKTATHAFKSTLSYGRTILTMMIFNVKSRKALPSDDGNAAGGGMDMASPEQIEALKAIAAKAERELSAVLEWAKVDDIAKLTAAKCDEAIAQLTRRAERIAKGQKNG